MKILHIHSSMGTGGIEAMICGLANEMSKTQDVTVCSIYKPAEDAVFWNNLVPAVHKLTLGKIEEGFTPSILFKIRNLIKCGNYDVVHLHADFYYYVLAVFTLGRNPLFFYTIHSDAKMENSLWSRYILPLKKRAFVKGYVHPITISEESNKSFMELYGIDGRVIKNGISRPHIEVNDNPLNEFRISSKTKVFVHPGRISKAKNQVVLCRVFDTLVREGYDVVLVIAGNKQDNVIYAEMESYFSERVRYVGVRRNVIEMLSEADGMCLPSIWEGLPVTLLEALSVGCVPICSPVGGIVDVIKNGENGVLSSSCSYNDYLIAMKKFLALSDKELKTLRENAQLSFSDYEISKTAESYIEYYQEFLN